MRIPKAPSWRAVFLFGAVYNAVVERCWWAVALCSLIVLIIPALDRLDRRLLG